jgi:hypothetical protein
MGLSEQDEVEFNILDPITSIRPILELINDDEIDVIVSDEKITFKKDKFRSSIFFCDPHMVNEIRRKMKDIDVNHSSKIDEEFIGSINKIIKTCIKLRFKSIYIGVEEGMLFIETTDRTNKFANKLRYELQKSASSDFVMCFSNSVITNLVKVMSDEYEKFNIDLSYLENEEVGRLVSYKDDGTESYYLLSTKENI